MAYIINTTTGDADDVSERRNTAESDQVIRRVDYSGSMSGQPAESTMSAYLSKSAARPGATGDEDPVMKAVISASGVGATSADAEQSASVNKSWLFPDGALTLETGEALHSHYERHTATGGSARHEWTIWYTF